MPDLVHRSPTRVQSALLTGTKAVVVATLAACTSGGGTGAGSPPASASLSAPASSADPSVATPGQAPLADVLGTTWTLTGIGDPAGSSAPVPQGVRTPTLVVAADGSTAIDTGCNLGRTTVHVAGDTLTFEPAAISMMACEPPTHDVEAVLVEMLAGKPDNVLWDGTSLTVNTGERSLHFTVK